MNKIIKGLTSIYRPDFPRTIVYMLQATEYDARNYLSWLYRVFDFSKVMHRRTLVLTRPARLLLGTMYFGMLAQVVVGLHFILVANSHQADVGIILMLIFILSTPIVWAHLIVLPLIAGRWLISKPDQFVQINHSKFVFKEHQAIKIAIAGSYGKTTMKEILLSVLSEGKKVAATPANKNVAISHAQFALDLDGDEDILIIEYGEGAPGDVARFSRVTKPDVGIITGLAPAHLDKYQTLKAAGEDIFSLANYLSNRNVYVNEENKALQPFIKKSHILFSGKGVDGWKVSDIKISINGTKFKLSGGGQSLILSSRLVGRHLIGPITLAAYLGLEFGLSPQQVEAGVAKIEPFEHRMQTRQLNSAWLIDDTYNGNIEGMEAGLKLLSELPAKRKVYITPGLVDQGLEEESVHVRLGKAIAKAKPDIVVLMQHSVTDYIKMGLENGRFGGQLIIEDDPLNFYTHLDKFVASGDVVLMQNDWPDQYE